MPKSLLGVIDLLSFACTVTRGREPISKPMVKSSDSEDSFVGEHVFFSVFSGFFCSTYSSSYRNFSAAEGKLRPRLPQVSKRVQCVPPLAA